MKDLKYSFELYCQENSLEGNLYAWLAFDFKDRRILLLEIIYALVEIVWYINFKSQQVSTTQELTLWKNHFVDVLDS